MPVRAKSADALDPEVLARVPVARGRALQRAVLRIGPAVLLAIVIMLNYQRLDFRRSAVTNRIVEYSWGVVLLAGTLVALLLAFVGVRWLLLAAWPQRLEMVGTREALELRLGPMGRRSYDVDRLQARYLFELAQASDEMPFEALLDEKQQMTEFLPQLTHPCAARRLDQVIRLYAAGPESAIAAKLRPFVEYCRTINPPPPRSTTTEEYEIPAPASGAATAPSFKVPRSYLKRAKPDDAAGGENAARPT